MVKGFGPSVVTELMKREKYAIVELYPPVWSSVVCPMDPLRELHARLLTWLTNAVQAEVLDKFSMSFDILDPQLILQGP